MSLALALSAPVVGAMPAAGVRLHKVVGDVCSSLGLRGGDFLMVATTDRYHYETTYLLDFGHGEAPYTVSPRAAQADRRMWVRHPNDWSKGDLIDREDFDLAVRAIVVAEVRVRDERLAAQAYGRAA